MEIDFVIPWVDGADERWRREMESYRPGGEMSDGAESRYRDWDNLRYWFRGVEAFAPWVRRVHFVTWGHLPEWLNVNHPGLHIVRHEDFIPREYLPVFSSHPIELAMHRIEGLADRFVYFNDDTFLLRPTSSGRFFRRGLPCDTARLGIIAPSTIAHIILNDVALINSRHDKRRAMRSHLCGWFNLRYAPSDMLKTLTLMPWSRFSGFRDSHMPQPFLRSTFERLWEQERATLEATMRRRFRNVLDCNQYLMRYEQLATGCFAPVPGRDCRLETLSEQSVERIASHIATQRYAMIAMNDSDAIEDFDGVKRQLNNAFEHILPHRSRYEL
ncbi:glycosyl transferase [Bacteroidia bacterium]|nr:glycosyl transferase [Bacteroidia bacterium]